MGEYIQSNDDSGNLALYAGIGVGAFAAGSALVAMAHRPSGKGKKRNPGFGDKVYDSNPIYSKGAKQFALGGMANVLSFGMLGGKKRDAGVKQMVDSIVSDHFNQGGYADSLTNLGHSIDEGTKTFKGDTNFVTDLIKKGHADSEIMDKLFEENPYTFMNDDDLVQLREKHKIPELNDKLIDQAHEMNFQVDADRAKNASTMLEKERTAEAAQQRAAAKEAANARAAAETAANINAATHLDNHSNLDTQELVKRARNNPITKDLPAGQLEEIADGVITAKNNRRVTGAPTSRAPHQMRQPGSAELSDSEKANLERRKKGRDAHYAQSMKDAPNAPQVPLDKNGNPFKYAIHPKNLRHKLDVQKHKEDAYNHWHDSQISNIASETSSSAKPSKFRDISKDTRNAMLNHEGYQQARGSNGRKTKRPTTKRGKQRVIAKALGL